MAVPKARTRTLQQRIYRFIVAYLRHNSRPPTYREIGSAVGITSTSHIRYHLSLLEAQGLIARHPEVSRGIAVTHTPRGIPVLGRIAAENRWKSLRKQRCFSTFPTMGCDMQRCMRCVLSAPL